MRKSTPLDFCCCNFRCRKATFWTFDYHIEKSVSFCDGQRPVAPQPYVVQKSWPELGNFLALGLQRGMNDLCSKVIFGKKRANDLIIWIVHAHQQNNKSFLYGNTRAGYNYCSIQGALGTDMNLTLSLIMIWNAWATLTNDVKVIQQLTSEQNDWETEYSKTDRTSRIGTEKSNGRKGKTTSKATEGHNHFRFKYQTKRINRNLLGRLSAYNKTDECNMSFGINQSL